MSIGKMKKFFSPAKTPNKIRGETMLEGKSKGRGETPAPSVSDCRDVGDQSAEGRTLPSLMRFSMTVLAMEAGTASYCLKIIVNAPRPWVTVRMALE